MSRLSAYAATFRGFGLDARLFLLTVLIFSACNAVYWTDFNLYLEALGLDRSTIGLLSAIGQVCAVGASLPAAALSDRLGRRTILAGSMALVLLAVAADLVGTLPSLVVGVAAFGIGTQAWQIVQIPFMAEHTAPEHRNEYFSMMFAISYGANVVAAIVGGWAAATIAEHVGLEVSVGQYQVLLVGVLGLGVVTLGSVFLLSNDRPRPRLGGATARSRFGIEIRNRGLFFKLLLPGFLTSLGAGQLIPFLNVFVKTKFNLGLPEVNFIFAVTSLGTAAAIIAQPAIARRFGRIGSIVLVQGASLPFLLVLGFSPLLWTVAIAMMVRNSLMNAGSPIFDAFAMDRVSAAERATLSAGMTLLWALGWAIAGPYYAILQAALGFTAGYAVDFVTIIALYTIATALLWFWFHDADANVQPVSSLGTIEAERVPFEAA